MIFGDFLPLEEINKFFDIPLWTLIILIFFFGYITLSWSKKKNTIPNNLKGIDDVFFLATSGLTWFLRIALQALFINLVLTWHGPINSQFIGFLILILLFTPLAIYFSLVDLQMIHNNKLFKSKKLNFVCDKSVIILSLIIASGFSFFFLAQGINEGSILFTFMIFFVYTPSIHFQIRLINKIH